MVFDPLTDTAAGVALIATSGEDYGRILRANHKLAELLASSPEALVGTRICDYVHPPDQSEAHHAFLTLLGDPPGLYEHDGRLVAADGRLVHVRAVASMISTGAGGAVILRVLQRAH